MSCFCGAKKRHFMPYEPGVTCSVTFFKRAWLDSEIAKQDNECRNFEDNLTVVTEVPIPTMVDVSKLKNMLSHFNYLMTKERNAAPIHDDASYDLKSCFDKYGISHESLA